MIKTNNAAMAILLQAYLKFEEYLRDGKSDLTAARLVAKNFYTCEINSCKYSAEQTPAVLLVSLPCQSTYRRLSLFYDNGEIDV